MTHDVSFINNVADSLLLIENGKITGFEGNLQQYNEENEV
ncbi:hypothetical protein HMPREF3187_00244 [Aerococcus christensenii]|uniref:Uncharacterized protein n=1 Tax=Aerococcus christensenii TaxID=87541 RepID=A0A133Y3S4_9LACT|nr:hypothetical protein HMPREF3187_00244 [Aerococcus christensenii]